MSKKKRKRIGIHTYLFIFLIIYLVWTYLGQLGLENDLKAKKRAYEMETTELKEDIKVLEEEIANSNSLEFIEKIAREELGMVKPREIVVIDQNK